MNSQSHTQKKIKQVTFKETEGITREWSNVRWERPREDLGDGHVKYMP
jgi:hypothetical protein